MKVKTSSKMTYRAQEVNKTTAFLIHKWSYKAPYMGVFHRVTMKYLNYGSGAPCRPFFLHAKMSERENFNLWWGIHFVYGCGSQKLHIVILSIYWNKLEIKTKLHYTLLFHDQGGYYNSLALQAMDFPPQACEYINAINYVVLYHNIL